MNNSLVIVNKYVIIGAGYIIQHFSCQRLPEWHPLLKVAPNILVQRN